MTGQSSEDWGAMASSSRVRRKRRRRNEPQPEPAGHRRRPWGIHNLRGGGSRESEQPTVARKRGNARGARGLYFSHVDTKEGRSD